MIKERRHKRILSALQRQGVVELAELARLLPEVSRVTLRRDIAELADAGALKRTHGGAVLPDADLALQSATMTGPRLVSSDGVTSRIEDIDAIILPPIAGRGGAALRRQVTRRGIPFLAESAPHAGGLYLGPDNTQAGLALGQLAGKETPGDKATVLMVCHTELPNTKARADGFEQGFRAAFAGDPTVIRVNGQGSFKPALRVALDAFQSTDGISVVFGVNDHTTSAVLEAADRIGVSVRAYAMGGENPEFVGRLAEDGPVRAVAALFPEVVGARGIDIVARALSGTGLTVAEPTPHAILTRDTVTDYYQRGPNGWGLKPDRKSALIGAVGPARHAGLAGNRVGFMPHYPAHDWYRIMIQSMQSRANDYGFDLAVSPPHQGIAAEIARLRREVAHAAVDRIRPGQTIILGEGDATRYLAEELHRLAYDDDRRVAGITVITNALDVLSQLEDAPHLKVILTSGEYQKADRCLVGPSVGALFERMRADLTFLSVAGVSPGFGLSALDERLALAGSRMASAARRTIALADHTLVGADANHLVARPGEFHELITDDGALPADRQSLRNAGVEVLVAGEEIDDRLGQTTNRPLSFGQQA